MSDDLWEKGPDLEDFENGDVHLHFFRPFGPPGAFSSPRLDSLEISVTTHPWMGPGGDFQRRRR